MQRRLCVYGEPFKPEEVDDKDIPFFPKKHEEEDRIWKALKNIFLFNKASPDDLEKIIGAVRRFNFKADEVVLKQGEEGDFMYIIDSGVFESAKEMEDGTIRVLQTYENEGFFGELALMYDVPRFATVVAVTNGSLWALDRRTFRKTVLLANHRKAVTFETYLSRVPMLAKLTEAEMTKVVDALTEVTFPDGERIIAEGDHGDCMYFIVTGSVKITKRSSSVQELEIARLMPGDFFGEMALIRKKPRAASAYAVGKVHLAKLDVQAFERLLGPCLSYMESRFDDYQQQIEKLSNSS